MMYNFTGGNFVTPTPLLFNSCDGDWHLPHPADYSTECTVTKPRYWVRLGPRRGRLARYLHPHAAVRSA